MQITKLKSAKSSKSVKIKKKVAPVKKKVLVKKEKAKHKPVHVPTSPKKNSLMARVKKWRCCRRNERLYMEVEFSNGVTISKTEPFHKGVTGVGFDVSQHGSEEFITYIRNKITKDKDPSDLIARILSSKK